MGSSHRFGARSARTWGWTLAALLGSGGCRPASEPTTLAAPPATDPTTPPSPPSSSAAASTRAPAPLELGDLRIDPDRIPRLQAHDAIPVDTSRWTEQRYDGPKTGRAVLAAIDAAPPRTILVLPPGRYTGPLVIHRSEIVVRGDCRDRSAVVWSHRGVPEDGVFSSPVCADGPARGGFCQADADCPRSRCDRSELGSLCSPGWLQLCGATPGQRLSQVIGPPQPWQGPFVRGTTTLRVAASERLAVGDRVWLASAVPAVPGEKALTDDLHYAAEITAIGEGTLTLDRGLPIDFSPEQATVRRLERVLHHAGVECLTLRDEAPSDPAGLYESVNLSVRGAWESWVYDVDLGDTFNTMARVERSARVVLLGNRFGEQHKSRRGDGRTCEGPVADNPCWNKQAIVFDEAHDCSLVDNVVHASIGVELSHGSSRNWIAYNWFPEPALHPPGESRRALFPHGNYAHGNVFEGNVFWGIGEMDTFWGSQGPRYTWFRNVALGPVARFSNQAPPPDPQAKGTAAEPPYLCSRETNYLLNHARRFGTRAGDRIDARSTAMHLERNTFSVALAHGDPTSRDTVVLDNARAPAGRAPAWDDVSLPDTLNPVVQGRAPAFWCTNTTDRGGPVCPFEGARGGVGARWDGRCVLPAQARSEGLGCERAR